MKKIFIILVILLGTVSIIPTYSYSQGATSSASTAPLDESEMKNVKKIIDLVASSSAEQKTTSKAGVIGAVQEVNNTSINIKTINGASRIIDIDEITKFSDPNSKTFGISDITVGETIGIIGILNKVSNHILARSVDRLDTLPIFFDGVITAINKGNFQITAVDKNGNEKILDVQTTTKIFSYTKTEGMIKAGFSKAIIGERVFAAGFPDGKIKNQIASTRIVLLKNTALSLQMKKYQGTIISPKQTQTPNPSISSSQ
ncbi:MAG: hypothetical protein KBC00_01975 [Candidatus Levybacteria bacterium]|nr:hypothetical protein [Candidatus Levybacteria bacterium]MBP9815372.1 hypothetical protein [Candidatus Levybacteria bacterium]